MGRGWVNAVRVAQGAKKGKLFTKLAKEITVAVKLGGDNPEGNARLRSALRDAQKNSMPKDTVERAIKRGTGVGNEADFEEITYEGYAPHGVAVVVETLTDNRNRTVQDLRAVFNKKGGNLGESGSVMWMFDRVGRIVAKRPAESVDPEEAAINAGANEVEEVGDESFCFFSDVSDFDTVATALEESGWEISSSELAYKPKTPTEISEEQENELQAFFEAIEENDDVKKVYLSI